MYCIGDNFLNFRLKFWRLDKAGSGTGLAKIIIFELSAEIENLLNFETNNTKNLSFVQKIIRYFLLKTGISNILEAKTEDIKLNF